MPDDDRFPRYLSPAWRKVLGCLEGHDPTERVADAVTKAVAATIRTIHGVPSLPNLAEKMREAASGGIHFASAPRQVARMCQRRSPSGQPQPWP